MTRIRVHTVIAAPRAAVWRDISNLASHVEWMLDAERIDFVGSQRAGVGTTFDCRTRIGPIALVDRMEIVEWRRGRRIGVRHTGVVRGTGRFRLRRGRGGTTRFSWDERLRFPWWLGGPLGATVAKPVLRRVWRINLQHLARRF